MRMHRALAALAVPVFLVAACSGGDDGGGSLSSAEQKYADAMAKDLVSTDDGFGVDAPSADCMATAVLDTIGVQPFEDAGVEPKDLATDKAPGELLGDGAVSKADAKAIAAAWRDCTDLPEAFAASAKDEFNLDAAGVTCLEKGLAKSKVLDDFIEVSFTSAESDDASQVLQGLVSLVDECTGGTTGDGGVIVDSIAASLAEGGTLTEEQAACVAQEVVDTIGQDRLISLTANGDFSNAPADVQQEFATAVLGAASACDIPISQLGG
jgi:hypothetical protein